MMYDSEQDFTFIKLPALYGHALMLSEIFHYFQPVEPMFYIKL